MGSPTATGLSPQVTFSLSLYTFGLGALVALLIIAFGLLLLKNRLGWRRARPDEPIEMFIHELRHLLMNGSPQKDVANLLLTWSAGVYADHLGRRNEFWVGYGQITVAVLLLTMVTVLLLTRTINPDAGLPILSGIAAFTIAKTTSGARSTNLPRTGNEG
jgi:hypothetical protein